MWRRLAAELMIPFRGGRAALWDLLLGSRAMAARWWRWTGSADGLKGQAERVCGCLAGAALGGYEVRLFAEAGVLVLVGAWMVAAWMHAPARRRPRPCVMATSTTNDHEMLGESEEKPPEQLNLAARVEHAVAHAKTAGRHGVHLSQLLADLHADGHLADATVTDLGAHLRALDIPIRDSLRVATLNRVGIHHDDLRKHLGHTPRLPPHMVPDLTPDPGAKEAALTGAPGPP